jgi:hypothetical protein
VLSREFITTGIKLNQISKYKMDMYLCMGNLLSKYIHTNMGNSQPTFKTVSTNLNKQMAKQQRQNLIRYTASVDLSLSESDPLIHNLMSHYASYRPEFTEVADGVYRFSISDTKY